LDGLGLATYDVPPFWADAEAGASAAQAVARTRHAARARLEALSLSAEEARILGGTRDQLSLSVPTGLADGLALKEQRYGRAAESR
jgi:hypothetical protein